jgi:tRNA(Ile)-lysidine synthase
VIDSTNIEEDYTRNQIRSRVIPALLSIQERAVESSVRLADALRADSLCLESMTDWFLSELCEDGSLELEKINGSPDAIVNRALMALFSYDSEGERLESVHLTAIRALCRAGRPHSAVSLPGNREAVIENGRLYFRQREATVEIPPYKYLLSDTECVISQTKAKIIISRSQKTRNVYKNSILLRLDSAKINGALIARSREGGDRIRIGGMSRSIKKLMCDKKIPLELRLRLPILCDEDGVLAVPLLGVRDGAAPAEDSDTVLNVWVDL